MTFVVKLEAAFGANLANAPATWTWTDISNDLLGRNGGRVQITRGRTDSAAQAQPQEATFELENTTGAYMPDNAMGAYYPNVTLNLPFRISINYGSGYVSRGIFYASSYEPSWDDSKDFPTMAITANGNLRRITQGNAPPQSALYSTISAATPTAFWSLEDGATSTSFASAVAGVDALRVTSGTITAGFDGPAGAVSAVDLTPGGRAQARLPAVTFGSPSTVRIAFCIKPDPGSSKTTPLAFMFGDGLYYITTYAPGLSIGFTTPAYGAPGIVNAALFDGGWHSVVIDIVDSGGGNVSVTFTADGIYTQTLPSLGAPAVTPISLVKLGGLYGTSIPTVSGGQVSSIAIWQPATGSAADVASAMKAWAGEIASARFSRVCGEKDIQSALSGTQSTAVMGPQTVKADVDLLRECEACDGGIMYDGIDGKLDFLTLQDRYNLATSLTVDNGGNQLPVGFRPVKDDFLTRNDWTISRDNGGSAEYSDTSSIAAVGLYPDSTSLNLNADAYLNDQAAWRVHLGTVTGLRYPQIPLNFALTPALIPSWVACDVGDRITLKNLPAGHPAGNVDLVLEGYTEAFDAVSWDATLNCSPYAPYAVGTLDSGRLDSEASTLAANYDAATTSLRVGVATTPVALWTVAAGDFPFDVVVAGEQITVTDIFGPPANFLGVNNSGFDSDIGTWSAAGGCTIAGSTTPTHSGSGSLAITATASGTTAAAHCTAGSILASGLPCSPGDTISVSAWFRSATVARSVVVGAGFYTAAGASISNLVGTSVTTTTSGWTKVTATVTAPATAAYCRALVEVLSVAGAGEVHYVDDAAIGNATTGSATQQTFTVTRAINGVSKAHNAGEKVSLLNPTYLSL